MAAASLAGQEASIATIYLHDERQSGRQTARICAKTPRVRIHAGYARPQVGVHKWRQEARGAVPQAARPRRLLRGAPLRCLVYSTPCESNQCCLGEAPCSAWDRLTHKFRSGLCAWAYSEVGIQSGMHLAPYAAPQPLCAARVNLPPHSVLAQGLICFESIMADASARGISSDGAPVICKPSRKVSVSPCAGRLDVQRAWLCAAAGTVNSLMHLCSDDSNESVAC